MCLAAPLRQPPPAVDGVPHSASNETTRPHMAEDEPLRQLHQMFPSRHRDYLSAVLLQCNNCFQDAVDLITSSSLEDEVQEVGPRPDSQGLPRSNAQPQPRPSSSSGVTLNLPSNEFHVANLLEKAASTNLLTCEQHSPLDNRYVPDASTECYYSLLNGDCGPHALGTMLMQMVEWKPTMKHEKFAEKVREYVKEFLRLNWFNVSKISKQPWHEIQYLTHNLAIPPDERLDYPDWGPDPLKRLQQWEAEFGNILFAPSEFICFKEAMEAHGIFAVFRIWRRSGKALNLLSTIPENPTSADMHLVFDFKHSGRNDTSDAHWELLKSGSASPSFLRGAQQQQMVAKNGKQKAEKPRVADMPRVVETNKKRLAALGLKQLAAEANQKRLEEEANQKRLEAEANQKRLAAEVEQARLAANAEKARLTVETQQVHTEAEAEKARLAAEVEQARLAANAEKARLAVEVQQVRTEAEAEKARVAAKKQEAPEAAEAEMNKGDGISNRKQEEGVDLPRKRQKTDEARMLKELKEYSSGVVSDRGRLGIGVFSRPSGSRRGR